jgi:hypothetical protein
MVFVDDSMANDALFLIFQRQVRNSSGGTDLATEIAVVFAVSEAGDYDRHKQAIWPRPEIIRIKGTPKTDLHTFTATDTFFLKIIFVCNAGRSEEFFRLGGKPKCKDAGEKKSRKKPTDKDSSLINRQFCSPQPYFCSPATGT